MSIVLVDTLSRLGIPPEDVAIEITDGESEHDGLISLGSYLILCELKDSRLERGHVDKLVGRVRESTPTHVLIWATEGLSDGARQYLDRLGLGTSAPGNGGG
jgi:hypothetical protein